MPEEEFVDPTLASMTPLEQQQVRLGDPAAHTFWHRVRFEIVIDQVRAVGANTVLDVGAGSGMLGDHVAHVPRGQNDDTITYRFAESSSVLDERLGAHFGDDARFDAEERVHRDTVIALLDVVEHIDDDVGTLRGWRERMDPGTRMVVTVPALQWAFSAWDADLGHYRRYSRGRLRSRLESAGLRVRRCDYLFPEMLPIVVKRKVLPTTNESVDMPRLGERANRFGYAVSSTSARLRRVWPAGTSVVAVAEA